MESISEDAAADLTRMSRRKRKPVEPLDRLPPHSIECEVGVLGCCLLAPGDCIRECLVRFGGQGVEVFYDLRHQTIWGAMVEAFKNIEAVDVITIQQKLKDAGKLDQVGGIAYLTSLPEAVPSAANLSYYLDFVWEKFELRTIQRVCADVSSQVYDFDGDVEELKFAALSDLGKVFEPSAEFAKRNLPALLDARDFVSKNIITPPQLIQGILHQGCKMAIGGGSKTFKTWTLIDLALSVSHGEPWLSFETRRARVCYVNLELPDWSAHSRILAVCRAKQIELCPGMFSVWNLRGHANDYRDLLPRLSKVFSEEKFGLLILDPTYKMLGNADENSARDINAFLNGLECLSQQSGSAIAFASHFSKGNQSTKDAQDRISGSGVFARDPDAILTFTRHEQEGAFTVESILRNCSSVEPFVVKWEYPLFHKDGQLDPLKLKQPKGRKPEHDFNDLLGVLPDEGLESKEWQRLCDSEHGISKATFHRLKATLEKMGKVLKSNIHGRWIPVNVTDNEARSHKSHNGETEL